MTSGNGSGTDPGMAGGGGSTGALRIQRRAGSGVADGAGSDTGGEPGSAATTVASAATTVGSAASGPGPVAGSRGAERRR